MKKNIFSDNTEMILVPEGEFLMGTTDEEMERLKRKFSSEEFAGYPQHKIWIDAFYIDKSPVTNAQYMKFVKETGYRIPEGEAQLYKEMGGIGPLQTKSLTAFSPWEHSDFNHPNQPVICVNWDDAFAYAEWAGKRLPTEAEWEKAARGTDGRIYPWGNELPEQGDLARANEWMPFDGCPTADNLGFKYIATSGSYPQGASPYGILDMAGNVSEWVFDWYDADYYFESPARNPKGPVDGVGRVIRGGSWNDLHLYLRCATRIPKMPAKASNNLGFRCVMSL